MKDIKFWGNFLGRCIFIFLVAMCVSWFQLDKPDKVFSSKSKGRWEIAHSDTLTGKGFIKDGAVLIAKFGRDIKPGDKVSMIATNGESFDVLWGDDWITKKGSFGFKSQCFGTGSFYIGAEDGVKVKLVVQRWVPSQT